MLRLIEWYCNEFPASLIAVGLLVFALVCGIIVLVS